jgi:hypothetical protein
MVRLYLPSLKGSRTQGSKPNKRGRNVSRIGAISVNKFLTSVNLIGTTDTITFEAFIIRKLVPKLGKAVCVLMDNCTIHTGAVRSRKKPKKNRGKINILVALFPRFLPY